MRRPLRRPALWLLLVAASILLSACGGRISTSSWAGLSSSGSKVYLAHGPGVLAYDTASQTASWLFPEEPNASLLFYSAPSVEGERVIFGDYGKPGGFFSPRVTVSVYAVEDASTSSTAPPPSLWTSTDIASDKVVAPTLQVGDRVYVGTADNHVVAVDATTGSVLWDYQTGHAIWGQPAERGGVLYVTSMDWSVYALNADSGELIWETELNGALPSRPVLGDDLVYVSSFDSSLHALDMATGEQRWAAPATNWIWGAPALADGVLYFGDIAGNLFAVNARTGDQLWTRATDVVVQTSPVVVGDTVYVASEVPAVEGAPPTGALTAYAISDGAQLWSQSTPAPLYTNPVVVDDTIVVANQNNNPLLTGFDLATGQELWRYSLPSEAAN